GILFAESVGTSGHIEVCEASRPHPGDLAGWNWLELGHRRCLDEIGSRFERGLHFVGYWHTHPERRPRPSTRDVDAMRRNLEGMSLEKLLAVIVGTSGDPADLCVATISRSMRSTSTFNLLADPIGALAVRSGKSARKI